MNLSPIVIFAYNRSHYLKQTLDALTKNNETKDSLIYIYCDGAKFNATEKELSEVQKVRNLAKLQNWGKETIVVESPVNQGLAKSIISGVSEIVEKHGRIIVLEDDLVTSPYFLNYINTALNKYENNDEVISIVGFTYPIDFNEDFPDTYFIKNADCLGWATWKRGWDLFEADAGKLIKLLENETMVREFNFNNQYPFMKMLKLVAAGKIDSWAIRWYASSFVNNKVSLFPKKSLVRHIGNVGSNIKADNSDIFGWELADEKVKIYESLLVENPENRNRISLHFRKYNRKRLSSSSLRYAFKRFILPMFIRNN